MRSKVMALLCCFLLLAGCTHSRVSPIELPRYQPASLKPPIEDRKGVHLPPKEGPPTPLFRCEPPESCRIAFNGVLIDGHLAAKYKLQKAERDSLRVLVQTDRAAFAATHQVYETTVNDLAQRAHRSWWDRSKGTVGFWGGVVVGMATAILAVYGVSRAEKAAE